MEVCDRLKVTKDWLYDQVEARRIPYVRPGRHLRSGVGALAAHIAEHSHPVRTAEIPAAPTNGEPGSALDT